MKTYEFKLENKIKFQSGSNLEEVDVIILNAPSAENKNIAIKLTQLVMQSITQIKNDKQEKPKKFLCSKCGKEEGGEEDGIDYEVFFYGLLSGGIDIELISNAFETFILSSNVAKINGEKLTKWHFNQLQHEDYLRLMGVYCGYFLLNFKKLTTLT